MEKSTKDLKAIVEGMKGLNLEQLQQELDRARHAQKEGEYVDVNGIKIDPKVYLTNLEAAERGVHPCFRWVQCGDAGYLHGAPADPSQRKLIRVYSSLY